MSPNDKVFVKTSKGEIQVPLKWLPRPMAIRLNVVAVSKREQARRLALTKPPKAPRLWVSRIRSFFAAIARALGSLAL